MVQKEKPAVAAQEQAQKIEQVKKRLDMLDERLDNIDSVLTAVVERVMKQPISISVTCPNCGRNIEIAILGSGKPGV